MDTGFLFEIFASQGIWATMFIGLFFYYIKRAEELSKKKEEKEKNLMDQLANWSDMFLKFSNEFQIIIAKADKNQEKLMVNADKLNEITAVVQECRILKEKGKIKLREVS